MGGIVKLALAVLAEITALSRARKRAPRVAVAALLLTLTFMMVAASFACAMAALWIWLLPLVGPWGAPLICAGVLALVAVALAGCGYWLARGRGGLQSGPGTLATAIETGDFAPLIHEHKWLLLALAALGGAVSAEKSRKTSRKR
ncbi:MAG: hypothetical protein KGI46_02825 [Alphaproteobacteria bacterium]|nr:hypothetical protein [Alphaproteobacteria bacterium]